MPCPGPLPSCDCSTTTVTCVVSHAYACLLAGSIAHRLRNAAVFCPWPSSPSLYWCNPSLLFPLLCLFARCFVAYIFVSSLGVPCDGLTGDGYKRFPECVSYTPVFSVFGTLSVNFKCKILRMYSFLVSSLYYAMSPIHKLKLPWHLNWIFSVRC